MASRTLRTIRTTADFIEREVIDDAKNVWIERDDLAAEGRVIRTVRLTEPRPQGAPEPGPQFGQTKPSNPFVVRVPAGPNFTFGHQAEKILYRGLLIGAAIAGTIVGIFDLIGKAIF